MWISFIFSPNKVFSSLLLALEFEWIGVPVESHVSRRAIRGWMKMQHRRFWQLVERSTKVLSLGGNIRIEVLQPSVPFHRKSICSLPISIMICVFNPSCIKSILLSNNPLQSLRSKYCQTSLIPLASARPNDRRYTDHFLLPYDL